MSECQLCGRRIEVQIFRGSGVCSENCRKTREKQPGAEHQ